MTKLDHDVRTMPPAAIRRTPKRRVTRASAIGTAAETIGPITTGCEISGLTNGQFSLIDTIEHVLNEIGPADITVSTWTMGIYDQERAQRFYVNGLIRSIRFVVDPSMFSRRAELSGSLVAAFGLEAFRAVNTHAKFATLRSDTHAVAVRSSMNLNPNNRLEHFDISECQELCGFFEAFVADVFERFAPPSRRNSQSRAIFQKVLDTFEVAIRRASGQTQPASDLDIGTIAPLDFGTWPHAD